MEVDVNIRKKRSDVSKRKNENKNISLKICAICAILHLLTFKTPTIWRKKY